MTAAGDSVDSLTQHALSSDQACSDDLVQQQSTSLTAELHLQDHDHGDKARRGDGGRPNRCQRGRARDHNQLRKAQHLSMCLHSMHFGNSVSLASRWPRDSPNTTYVYYYLYLENLNISRNAVGGPQHLEVNSTNPDEPDVADEVGQRHM